MPDLAPPAPCRATPTARPPRTQPAAEEAILPLIDDWAERRLVAIVRDRAALTPHAAALLMTLQLTA